MAGWLEASTGTKQYAPLANLIAAAFAAASDKEPPKWVDRLAIEMHRKVRRRRSWIRQISS
jgi:hypothetical protein